jgi:hypothetical protein
VRVLIFRNQRKILFNCLSRIKLLYFTNQDYWQRIVMLEVHLLGKFEIKHNKKQLNISSRPAQSLFAYLILSAGTAHRREKLAGMLWPDSLEETMPVTRSLVQAQTVPDAAAQGVANYLRAHSANLPATTVIDPAAQSVLDYINLHSNDKPAIITDPAAQSVMDYLKAHGIK